ncbi:hypothetical protein ILUMI_00920, partial [Ignelater luminosus]
MHLIHELNEDDSDRRLQFCENLMLRCDRTPNLQMLAVRLLGPMRIFSCPIPA